ncbi:MAG: hypothetical protein ACPLRR_07335 [Candidatus Saccharicenans sp.]
MRKDLATRPFRFLFFWAMLVFLSLLLFIFLHECAHGLGSKLEGLSVSTGFNRVGDAGKRPSDPDFRSNHLISGQPTPGSLAGPLLNWFLALLFTFLLFNKNISKKISAIFGAAAISNSLLRFVPMMGFLISALMGRLVIEDEVSWGFRGIFPDSFPMLLSEFKGFLPTRGSIFLSNPSLYFWPAISFLITFICLFLAYKNLLIVFKSELKKSVNKVIFILMPVIIWPPLLVLVNLLDNLVRINW